MLKIATASAVFVFALSSPVAAQTYGPSAYLKESQAGRARFLGNTIAFDGQRIAAGNAVGNVAIFAQSGGTWIEEGLIDVADRLDLSSTPPVALSAVGAPRLDSPLEDAGAVFVFTRQEGGTWEQSAFLQAAAPETDREFGSSVALEGSTLVVADIEEVYVLEFSGGDWTAAQSVTSGGFSSGYPPIVAFDGERIAIGNSQGASDGELGAVSSSGSVEVYVRDGASWVLEQSLQASNAANGDQFGFSLAIRGDRLIVGARSEDSAGTGVNGDKASNGATTSGAAYIFELADGEWTETAYLKALAPTAYDRFGTSVSIDGNLALVGAPFEDSKASSVNGDGTDDSLADSGAAWVFEKVEGAWISGDYLKAPNPGHSFYFGDGVALSGDTIVIASPREDSSSRVINAGLDLTDADRAGALYVYTPDGELPEPVDIVPEVEFRYDPGAPQVRLYEGDSSSSLPIFIGRTSTAGSLTVSFRLAEESEATASEVNVTGGGASNPELSEINGVYTFTFAPGQNQASYRLRAVTDVSDEAEPLESIVLEIVASDDYTINDQLSTLEAAIRPQGYLVTNTNESGAGSLR